MANNLLKLEPEQEYTLQKWYETPGDYDPNNVFMAMGKATGSGKYLPKDQLRPSLIDNLAGMVGLQTEKMKQVDELQRDQKALLPFVEMVIKAKMAKDIAQANAPTYREVNAEGADLPAPLKPMPVELPGPGMPVPNPDLHPDTPGSAANFSLAMEGKLPAWVEGKRPIGTALLPALDEKLSPFHQSLLPTRLKPRPDLVDPATIQEEVRFGENLGNLEKGTSSKLMEAPPSKPLPRTTVQAGLSEAARRLGQQNQGKKTDMGDYIESASLIASKQKYGKAMPFAELAEADPILANKVRQQAAIDERKDMYQFEQTELGKRQLALAGPIAEETAKSREAVQSDIRLAGPTMMMSELTGMVDKLFLPESAGGTARAKQAIDLRGKLAMADPTVTKWQRSISTALRPQLARAEGEVGNLAAQEQLNAAELIPDPMGGTSSFFPFVKLPDTRETAIERLKLATNFIELASKAPKGERETSDVQKKLKGIKAQLEQLEEKNAKALNSGQKALTDMTKEEFEYAKNLAAQGLSKDHVEALIRSRRAGVK